MFQTIFKSLVLLIILSQSLFAEPAKKESIVALMKTTKASNMTTAILEQMLPALHRINPDIPKTFWDDFVRSVDPNELTDLIIPIYQKYFNEDDIQAMLAFYQSKSGQKMIQSQSRLLQESMLAGEKWGQSIAEQIIEKHQSLKR